MQSAILGFGLFRLLERYETFQKLSMFENVIIQTTAVATATMPLAAGAPCYMNRMPYMQFEGYLLTCCMRHQASPNRYSLFRELCLYMPVEWYVFYILYQPSCV